MAGKDARWLAALVLVLGLLAPRTARAGVYIGEWSWCWHPAPECNRGEYCWLHYWAPDLYKVRAWVRPSNLDQYPPGPCPPIPPTYQFTTYRCPSTPAAPTAPYANPAAYYGQQGPPE